MNAKDQIKAIRQKEIADARDRAKRLARLQARRNSEEPPIDEENGVSEAEEVVRENCEWESYPGMWVPKYSSWSDYSGSFVERSNGAYWMERYPEIFEQVGGGHGTVWTGIPHDNISKISFDTLEQLRDELEGLEDYPLLDEEKHSEMEWKAKEEFWEEDGRNEFRKELIAQAGDDVMATLGAIYMPNEELDELMRKHDLDQEMETEEGGGVYFRAERAAEAIDNLELSTWAEAQPELADVERRAFLNHLEEFVNTVGKAQPEWRVGELSDNHLFQLFRNLQQLHGPLWQLDDDKYDDPAEGLTFNDYELQQAIHQITPERIKNAAPTDDRQLMLPLHQQAEALARLMLQPL